MTAIGITPKRRVSVGIDRATERWCDRGMGNIIRGAALAAAVFALGASAKSKPFTPAEAVAAPDSIEKAKRVLSDRGYTVDHSTETQVVTAWEESNSMGTDRRMRWNVTINGGFVRVVSQCQFRLEDPGPFSEKKWDDCGDSQPAERTSEADEIATEIGR